jgi:signal transduction histidine kinase
VCSQHFSMFRRWLTIGLVACCYPGTCQSDPLSRSVLILNESSPEIQGYLDITAAQRSTLNAQSPSPFAIYVENLSLNEFGAAQYQKTFLTYLREKYVDTPIGIVAANGIEALRVALQLRADERWSGIAIVFSAVDEQRARSLMPLPNVTGRFVQFSLSSSIDAARALVKNLRQVVLVGDPLDRQPFRRHFLDELASAAVNLEIINLLGLPLEQVKKRVAGLPDNSAILYTTVTKDGTGHQYLPNEALAAIAKTANRPIVVDVYNRLGHGATGGIVIVSTLIGEEAAHLMLRVFNGENASAIPITTSNAVKPVFDWRELQRWGVNERDLPPRSEILFRPPSAWEQYRWQILLGAAVILTQTLLILGLLYEHQRRRRAEVQSLQRMTELAHLNRVATAGELSASIAHEVKQPLAAIVAQCSAGLRWLARATPDINEAQSALNQIMFAGNRASEIVDDLRLMFRKESSGRRPLEINTLLANVIELTRHEAQKQGISVRTTFFDGPNPQTLGERAQLEQVFLNLVMNAIEAMSSSKSDHRVLELKTSVNGRHEVLVTVVDSGPGVDVEKLEKIFDAFFTTKPNGMGMGLSICKTIIESHEGSLTAVPNKPHGMEFRVVLPIAA